MAFRTARRHPRRCASPPFVPKGGKSTLPHRRQLQRQHLERLQRDRDWVIGIQRFGNIVAAVVPHVADVERTLDIFEDALEALD